METFKNNGKSFFIFHFLPKNFCHEFINSFCRYIGMYIVYANRKDTDSLGCSKYNACLPKGCKKFELRSYTY